MSSVYVLVKWLGHIAEVWDLFCCNKDVRVVDVHHRDFRGVLLHNRHLKNLQEHKKGGNSTIIFSTRIVSSTYSGV